MSDAVDAAGNAAGNAVTVTNRAAPLDDPGIPRDAGVAALTRPRPCALRTWCVLEADHGGPCVEVPRVRRDPPDFGPKRGKR